MAATAVVTGTAVTGTGPVATVRGAVPTEVIVTAVDALKVAMTEMAIVARLATVMTVVAIGDVTKPATIEAHAVVTTVGVEAVASTMLIVAMTAEDTADAMMIVLTEDGKTTATIVAHAAETSAVPAVVSTMMIAVMIVAVVAATSTGMIVAVVAVTSSGTTDVVATVTTVAVMTAVAMTVDSSTQTVVVPTGLSSPDRSVPATAKSGSTSGSMSQQFRRTSIPRSWIHRYARSCAV